MHRAVRNDSATQRHCFYIVWLEDGQQAFRCQPTWRGINWSFGFNFSGGGVGRFYTVCEMNTHACVLIKSLFVLKKTADFKSSFITTRFSA